MMVTKNELADVMLNFSNSRSWPTKIEQDADLRDLSSLFRDYTTVIYLGWHGSKTVTSNILIHLCVCHFIFINNDNNNLSRSFKFMCDATI